ncbi:MAG: hypothetical protein FWD71_16080 [Oscillospiraceae bacterium]|nr:hypothetical protein [Oscillospiraceae bacterium]
MKRKIAPIYFFIAGLLILVGDALYYHIKLTPRTRMFPQLSGRGAIIMFVIGIILIVIGVIGILRNKYHKK